MNIIGIGLLQHVFIYFYVTIFFMKLNGLCFLNTIIKFIKVIKSKSKLTVEYNKSDLVEVTIFDTMIIFKKKKKNNLLKN